MMTNTDITEKHHSAGAKWSRLKSLAPIVISSIALVLSLLSLIWSQLMPAQIQVFTNESGYLLTEADNLMSIHLYLSFVNNGARPGVVRKVAMLIRPLGKPDGYLLEAAFFDRLDEQGNYTSESVMGPISIDGHKTVSRQIRFLSNRDSPGDFSPLLVRGEYHAKVLVWTSTNPHPTTTTDFPFTLSDAELKNLREMQNGEQIESVEIRNKNFQRLSPRVINEKQIDDLLGD